MAEGGGGHAEMVKRAGGQDCSYQGGNCSQDPQRRLAGIALLAGEGDQEGVGRGGVVQIRTRQACPIWRSENCK